MGPWDLKVWVPVIIRSCKSLKGEFSVSHIHQTGCFQFGSPMPAFILCALYGVYFERDFRHWNTLCFTTKNGKFKFSTRLIKYPMSSLFFQNTILRAFFCWCYIQVGCCHDLLFWNILTLWRSYCLTPLYTNTLCTVGLHVVNTVGLKLYEL